MRKLAFFLVLFLEVIGTEIQAQEKRWNSSVDLGLSAAKDHFTVATGYSWLYGFGKKQRFQAGLGVRYSGTWVNNGRYTTSPAKLTSGKEGPQVLFSDDTPETIDTMYASGQFNMLNLAIYLQYQINPKLEVGFNIDAIGFSVGPKKTGDFASVQSDNIGLENVGVKPYPFNALLVSDNDFGSLNSEIYLRYHFNEKWSLKAGGTFIFSEYQTDSKIAFDNNRFRNKSLQGLIGIAYHLGKGI